MPTQTSIASMQSARVLIVDDHPTVCEGLEHRISSQPDMTVCGKAANVQEALQKIVELEPNVVIIDLGLKNSNGLELIKLVKARHGHIRTLVHSMYDESNYASRCLHAGALGYVHKEDDPNEVILAIRDVLSGRIHVAPELSNQLLDRTFRRGTADVDPMETLTDRQMEVFRLIGEGLTTAKIASKLHISVHTVETHRENIKRKLQIESINELTRRAVLWTSANT